MAKAVNTVLKLKDQFSTPMKKCATACQVYNGKAKTTKKDTENLAKALKNNLKQSAKVAAGALVAVGTAAVATGTKLVKNTMEQADLIDKTSQKLGISRKAYQELDFVMSQAGVDITQFKTGTKTLLKNMDAVTEGNEDAIKNFKKLGVSVVDSKGKMKDQETVLYDTIKAFQKMENGSEKSRLAQELFGKQGQELSALLNSQSGSFDETIKKAHELGLVMGDETIDAGVKLTDTMDQAKRALATVGYQIGGELMPYVQSACDYVINHMPEIKQVIGNVKTVLMSVGDAVKWVYDHGNILIPILGGIVAGFAAFKIISTVSAIMATMQGVMTLVTGTQIAFNASLLACPITWIVIGIAAIVAAGIALYKNWDKVCAWAEKLKEKFNKLIAPIKKVFNWLGKVTGFSGKTVDVNVNKGKSTTNTPTKKHATGTSYFSGGLTGFSEGGRSEAAIFPSGTKIIPADKTQKALSANNGGVTVYVTVQGNMIGNESAMEQFGQYIGNKILTAMDNV